MLKRLLLTSALVAGFSSAALAHPHGPTVTLGGHIDTQLGYTDQKPGFDTTTAAVGGPKVHEFAIVNDTKLHVKVDGKKSGMKYGGKVVINADTSNNKTNHDTVNGPSSFSNSVGYTTMGYVETNMGRVEAGTTTGAVAALQVNAASVAHATGGVAGDWRFWVNPLINTAANAVAPNTNAVAQNFITTPNLPTNHDTGGEDRAAKVSYFTPKWNGFSAAVSYIPDTEQHGTVSHSHIVTSATVANTADTNLRGGFKDVFSGGVHYDAKVKGVKFTLSALGETGSAKRPAVTVPGPVTAVDKREDLSAYEFGAKVHWMGVTFAGSYGDWNKSGAFETVNGVAVTGKRDASYWNVGAGYEMGAWGMSVGYFESKQGNAASAPQSAARAELSNISVGVDYKLAPGFMPYVEANFFDMDEKRAANNGKNSGAVILAGTKLVF